MKKQTISYVPKIELGDLITTKELRETLKTIKHNKSPGMDGFRTEFLNVFWYRLKHFITNAIFSFKKEHFLLLLNNVLLLVSQKEKRTEV